MIVLMLMAIALLAGLCVLAYTLAVYALPFMLGVEVARWAYASGSGLIGAGLVGLVTGAVAYGLLIVLFMAVRPPILLSPWRLFPPRLPPLRAMRWFTASRARPRRPRSGARSSA